MDASLPLDLLSVSFWVCPLISLGWRVSDDYENR